MTKEDVYYETLQLPTNNITFGQNFAPPVYQVLINKFPSLKQAFKVYQLRNEPISKKEFDYVMKKLDITDLVVPEQERTKIYVRFS